MNDAPDRDVVIFTEALQLPAGDRVGRYKLLQQVVEGGCGVVFMAEQEEPVRRRVAELIRVIKITEYCDQHSLATEQRLELFVHVCRAIQHGHQKGIMHRDIKLAIFCTAPAIRSTRSNLLCEVIGTATLVFGALAIASGANLSGPGWATGLGPLLVGLLVFAIGLSLGGPTGYAINPVRDLGPRLAHANLPIADKGGSDWSFSWIPVAGPIAGGLLGGLGLSSTLRMNRCSTHD